MKKIKQAAAILCCAGILAAVLCGCGKPSAEDALEMAKASIGSDAASLIQKIGSPQDSYYASSCLGDGEDGELYYETFTVYTFRDADGKEQIYDVMENEP